MLDNRCKCAAGIVLYNPDIDRLKANIDAIKSQVHNVYTFDNGSTNQKEISDLLTQYNDNVILILNEKNLGIATALNRLVDAAHNDNHAWILTLDQDSVVPVGLIEKLLQSIDDEKVGIVCPVFYDFRRNNIPPPVPKNVTLSIDFCITSGSLLNIAICKEVGKFDDWLFIGLVDNEYCYRLTQCGYKITKDLSLILDHELGDLRPSKHRELWLILGKILHCNTIAKLSYQRSVSPARLYYATRNMVHLNRKYPKNEVKAWSKRTMIKNALLSIARGKHKGTLIRAVIKGIRDGNGSK